MPMSSTGLTRAVERLAGTFEATGFPPMCGRVFAYILAANQETYTARDLGDGLSISPAAVSGAVRWLIDSRLLRRERIVGQRAEVFRISDGDVWGQIAAARIPILDEYARAAEDALELLDGEVPPALAETVAYFQFTREDFEGFAKRWEAYRAEHLGAARRR